MGHHMRIKESKQRTVSLVRYLSVSATGDTSIKTHGNRAMGNHTINTDSPNTNARTSLETAQESGWLDAGESPGQLDALLLPSEPERERLEQLVSRAVRIDSFGAWGSLPGRYSFRRLERIHQRRGGERVLCRLESRDYDSRERNSPKESLRDGYAARRRRERTHDGVRQPYCPAKPVPRMLVGPSEGERSDVAYQARHRTERSAKSHRSRKRNSRRPYWWLEPRHQPILTKSKTFSR